MSHSPKLAFALAALCLLFAALRADGSCQCGGAGARPCAAFWEARAVFSGVVTSIRQSPVRFGGSESDRPFNYLLVSFHLEERFRGARRVRVHERPARPLSGRYKSAPNNGMHPTADTPLVKYLQRLGSAGDAGRWAAIE